MPYKVSRIKRNYLTEIDYLISWSAEQMTDHKTI